MKNIKSIALAHNVGIMQLPKLSEMDNTTQSKLNLKNSIQMPIRNMNTDLAEILFITSYPPRECGIATYSQDLIKSLENKFSNSLSIKVCALEPANMDYAYPEEVKYMLNTSIADEYKKMAVTINKDNKIKIVMVQHEFGFFRVQEEGAPPAPAGPAEAGSQACPAGSGGSRQPYCATCHTDSNTYPSSRRNPKPARTNTGKRTAVGPAGCPIPAAARRRTL